MLARDRHEAHPEASPHGHHPRQPRPADDLAMENRPGDRKWIRSRDNAETPRLLTNSDRSEEALNDWGRQMPTIENEDYRVETGRHIEYRHSGTTTEARRRRADTVPQRPAHLAEPSAVAANRKQELLRSRVRPAAPEASRARRLRARQPNCTERARAPGASMRDLKRDDGTTKRSSPATG